MEFKHYLFLIHTLVFPVASYFQEELFSYSFILTIWFSIENYPTNCIYSKYLCIKNTSINAFQNILYIERIIAKGKNIKCNKQKRMMMCQFVEIAKIL